MRDRASVRRAALEVVLESEETERFVDELLGERLSDFSARDRRLLQEITYGAVRHQNTLDRSLDIYLKLGVPSQRPRVRWALRLGAYQVVYLLRVPAHAAVNGTLEALKDAGASRRDVGFVNAVLHRLVDDIHLKSDEPPLDPDDPSVIPIRQGYCRFRRPVLPLRTVEPAAHLASKHSHPQWLVERWRERFGDEEAEGILVAGNRTPPLSVRLTHRAPALEEVIARLGEEGYAARAGEVAKSVVIERGGDLAESGAFGEGWFQVQDLTAIELGRLLDPPAGARVLDLCAAPGGKAGQLLEAVGPDGHLVAADRRKDRIALTRESLGRLGSNFTLVELPDDPDRIDLGESFSHVLVDAPCSNTGVLARRPDARWRLRPRDLASLTALQSKLLEAAFRHLRPRGRLVYSTCSIESEENEERVADLVHQHPEMTELRVKHYLPHRAPGDGGFGSLLLREA